MKKFIKNNLKIILAVSATAIICISGTAFATYQYNAKQIKFNEGKSVEDALNELYRTNSIDLLWTNPSPKDDFLEKTISMDLSKYKYALVIINLWTQSDVFPRTAALIPIGDMESNNWNELHVGAAATSRFRAISANNTGITISNEKKVGDNNEIIPLYIYGVNDIFGIWNIISGQ